MVNNLWSLYCFGNELSTGRLPAAEAGDIENKRRCLNAVLQLDAENEPAALTLVLLDEARPSN
jgi:hypothetical protein